MIAYLDNSATTKPSDAAINAMVECMQSGYFNPSSLYRPAIDVELQIKKCRDAVLDSFGVSNYGVVFTSGGTEANNLAILGSLGAMRGNGHIVISAVEHPSVMEAFNYAYKLGHEISICPVDSKGIADLDALAALLREDTALVSIMHVNNETGTIQPIRDISERVKKKNPKALLHVDGVQGYLRVPFDLKLCDMYTISAHKIHGPKGVGALVYNKNVRFVSRQFGGGQESGLRSGTENTPGILGLNAAIKCMGEVTSTHQKLMEKKLQLYELICGCVPNVLINGPELTLSAPHILNLSFPNVRGEVMLHALEAKGVYVSTGSACSSKKIKASSVLLAMGQAAEKAQCAIRLSLSPYTTTEEIEYAAQSIGQCYSVLAAFRRK